MAFQAPIMSQGWDMGASLYPGFNTMANAYNQATTQLGPSLLSYLANQQAKEASLAETARWHDMMMQGQDQQRLANLITAMGNLQGQQALREQGKAGTVAGMVKDVDQRKGLEKEAKKGKGWFGTGFGYKPSEMDLTRIAAQQYDVINPMAGTGAMQQTQGILQQLINQQLAGSLVQPGAPMVPMAPTVGGQGGAAQQIYISPSTGKQYIRNPDGSVTWLS